jgi:hypothetical protein
MSAGRQASGKARSGALGEGRCGIAVGRGGGGARRESAASSWLSGGAEFDISARSEMRTGDAEQATRASPGLSSPLHSPRGYLQPPPG